MATTRKMNIDFFKMSINILKNIKKKIKKIIELARRRELLFLFFSKVLNARHGTI
jgi:hypothetical protein